MSRRPKQSEPAASPAPEVGDVEAQRRAIRAETAIRWWSKFGDLPGWLDAPDAVEALLAHGVPGRWLWRAGIRSVPEEMRSSNRRRPRADGASDRDK